MATPHARAAPTRPTPAGAIEARWKARESAPATLGVRRILVVDADPVAAERTARLLRQNLYDVEWITNASVAFVDAAAATSRADLIVLEPLGPVGAAPEVWRQLLSLEPPVLVFSRAADPLDRVAGLELGAEDYLGKDAHPLEFLARVRAILRRGRRVAPRAERAGWRLQLVSCRLTSPGGAAVWLARSELELLRVLAEHPWTVLTRDVLSIRVYGDGHRVSRRAIDARVVRLRDRLEAVGGRELIRTVRPCGWALDLEIDLDES